MMDPLLILGNQNDVQMNMGPQILNVGANHWVVVVGARGLDKVEVFDSLSAGRVHPDLHAMCSEVYGDGCRLELQPSLQQVGGSDCGLFAIAVQDAVLRGRDVRSLRFDQSCMRSHLAQCFRAGRMFEFPLVPSL